tara:strand:+ start:209 stop:415 length:207 start_codon:yes stop_codon:yes gene_type:complete
MKQWNVRTIASVQYYEDQIVEANTKEEAERIVEGTFGEYLDVIAWNEYHEGDNVELRIDKDSTEIMEG